MTLQIASTILQVLGLKPGSLQSVQMEGRPVFPGVQ
jgi:hypothetical protein